MCTVILYDVMQSRSTAFSMEKAALQFQMHLATINYCVPALSSYVCDHAPHQEDH